MKAAEAESGLPFYYINILNFYLPMGKVTSAVISVYIHPLFKGQWLGLVLYRQNNIPLIPLMYTLGQKVMEKSRV